MTVDEQVAKAREELECGRLAEAVAMMRAAIGQIREPAGYDTKVRSIIARP